MPHIDSYCCCFGSNFFFEPTRLNIPYQPGIGYYESPHLAFTQQLRDAVARASGSRVALKVLTGGTDAINLKPRGIPCLGFGAGLRGAAHTPNERVSIENLVLAAKVYALLPMLYVP